MPDDETMADNTVDTCDPEGDVILVVGESTAEETSKYLVSSKILSVASPVFKALFSRNFAEGIEVRKGTCPEIALPEDSPEAMEAIFQITHFLETDDVDIENTSYLANIAIHAHKYDCIRAVSIWMRKAFTSFRPEREGSVQPKAFGHLIMCAYVFRDEWKFSSFVGYAQTMVTLDDIEEWERDDLLKPLLLPNAIKDTIRAGVEYLSKKLIALQQGAEKRLTVKRGEYPMEPWCQRQEEKQEYCTLDSRMAQYSKAMRETAMPLITPAELKKYSAHAICTEMSRLSMSLYHFCQAKGKCPLKWEVRNLQDNSWDIAWEANFPKLSDFL